MRKFLTLLICCMLIVACSDDKRYAPKEGRLAVFEADLPTQATGTIQLSKETETKEWISEFYNLKNKQPNIMAIQTQKVLWDERAGNKEDLNRLLPTPIATNDALYVLDGTYTLSKQDIKTGKKLWSQKLGQDKTGLTLTMNDKILFALSADGLLTAVSDQGKQLWQKDLEVAIRAPMQADKNALYIVTTHDQFLVLNPKNGNELWHYQTTKPQTLLTTMAPVAKSNNIIVVPFATGEVIAFDADSGLMRWIQMMVGNRPQDLTEVPQIAAAPVIENNVVYLTGNANLTGAYNLKTGETKWTNTFGSRLTPIVSGNTLFVMTTNNQLMALDKETGKLFWQKSYTPESKNAWQSMMLVNDQLVLVNQEELIFVDPQKGETIRSQQNDIFAKPIIVDGHWILMDNKTNVTVY